MQEQAWMKFFKYTKNSKVYIDFCLFVFERILVVAQASLKLQTPRIKWSSCLNLPLAEAASTKPTVPSSEVNILKSWILLFFFFLCRVSLCCSGCPGILFLCRWGWSQLRYVCASSVSPLLGLQKYAIMFKEEERLPRSETELFFLKHMLGLERHLSG